MAPSAWLVLHGQAMGGTFFPPEEAKLYGTTHSAAAGLTALNATGWCCGRHIDMSCMLDAWRSLGTSIGGWRHVTTVPGVVLSHGRQIALLVAFDP
ncbi:MAG: hypothetical protein GY832_32225 [Chloroflexi bacterium]|nr:hypothetical protein [Chloroflexota bacterium]